MTVQFHDLGRKEDDWSSDRQKPRGRRALSLPTHSWIYSRHTDKCVLSCLLLLLRAGTACFLPLFSLSLSPCSPVVAVESSFNKFFGRPSMNKQTARRARDSSSWLAAIVQSTGFVPSSRRLFSPFFFSKEMEDEKPLDKLPAKEGPLNHYVDKKRRVEERSSWVTKTPITSSIQQ